MPRPSHSLQKRRDRPRRPYLNHQIDFPNINPQFQRRRRHQRLERPAFQPMLRIQPPLLRERAVMTRHLILPHHLAKPCCNPLRQFARVHKNQCRAMLIDQLRDLLVNLIPLLVRANRRKRRGWHDDLDIHLPPMSHIHQLAIPSHPN